MNIRYIKKSILLLIFFLVFCIGSYAETIKILAIGNSFSEDAVENYLYELGQAGDVTFIIGNMYIGGCSLETHWNNAKNNNAAYSYRKIVNGTKTTTDNTRLETAIADEDWDYISFQQVSQNSGLYKTYFPYLTNLLAYVKERATNPDVQYVMHMTWAYQQNSTHSGFANYGRDQMKMYEAITDAVTRVAEAENIDIIIPAGTAIQNARTSFLGDNLCRDGYHLDYGTGRYIAACTWYEKLTGKNVVGNAYAPSMTGFRKQIAQNAAHAAVQSPLALTDLSSSLELDMPAGNLNAWELKAGHNGMSCGVLDFTEPDVTIELWLNIPEENFINGATIMSSRHDGNRGFSIDINSDKIRVFFRNSDPTSTGVDNDKIFTMHLPKESFVDKWGHMAFVCSSTENEVRSYLNGELNEKIDDFLVEWRGNHTSELRVGYWYSDAGKIYGKMSDIRIWNTSRTDAEIKANYNKPLTGTEPGLYIYYNFNAFHQIVDNIAAPERNAGTLQPTTNWDAFHGYEVLAGKPVNIVLADNIISWEAEGQSWDIELVSKEDETLLKSATVNEKSFSVDDLAEEIEYYIHIRTLNNGFYSGWVNFDAFPEDEPSGLNPPVNKFDIYSAGKQLIIHSDIDSIIHMYSVTGQLIRNINICAGINYIDNLSPGVYLINNQKIIIR